MNQGIVRYEVPISDRELMYYALKGTLVAESSLADLAEVVSSAVERAIFYLGLNKSSDDRTMLKMMLIEDCKNKFFMLSLDEIKKAIDNGSRGIYGECRGMAPKDCFNWIVKYKNDPLRLEVKKEKEDSEADEFKHIPTESEQTKAALYIIENAWLTYAHKGEFFDYGNSVYDLLSLNRKINYTADERAIFKEKARVNLLAYHTPEKHFGNDIKMADAIKIVAELRSENESIRVISEAKRLALTSFFAQLKEQGLTIYDVFK